MIFSTNLMEKIKAAEAAKGFWINLGDPSVSLLAGILEYDWVMVDTEHNSLNNSDVQNHIYALSGYKTSCIVRVKGNKPEHMKWVLDSGAAGIIVPSIVDAKDAADAVKNAKYYPLGERGYGPNRVSGFMTDVANYNVRANSDVMLICQVELGSAVEDIEKICSVKGIDGIWIGPTDLAQSLGHLGVPSHSDVQNAIKKVIDTANRHKMPWGIPTASAADFNKYVSLGGTIMTIGSDTSLLRIALSNNLNELKKSAVEKQNSNEGYVHP